MYLANLTSKQIKLNKANKSLVVKKIMEINQ